MTEGGMRAAVFAHLVEEPIRLSMRTGRGVVVGLLRFATRVARGADPATIEFVKTKDFSNRQLHEVDYVNHRGWTMHALIETRRAGRYLDRRILLAEEQDQPHGEVAHG